MKNKMKHRTIILEIFLLKLLYLSCSTVCQQSSDNISVLDFAGYEVQSHTKYHVLPAAAATGGGLSLSARDSRYPCPHNVMQEALNSSMGLSLEIFPLELPKQQQTIKLSTDVNIVFLAATVCVQSTVWRLGGVDPSTGRRYVRSNGKLGRQGAETVANWFKIERDNGSSGEGYYKIVHCPSVCSACGVGVCEDVGVFVENGRRWLGLGGDKLSVVFKKALDSHGAS